MFTKKKLEEARKIMHKYLVGYGRVGGSTISSGFVKQGMSHVSAYARTTVLGKMLKEELGERGLWELSYNRDKTLTMKLKFSWGKGDGEYDLLRETFYDNEEDEEIDEFTPYENLNLQNVTNSGTTNLIYTYTGVELGDLENRIDRLVNYVDNLLDVFYENLMEEYGED